MAAIDALNGSAHYEGAKHPIKVLVGPFCFPFYFLSSTTFFFYHSFTYLG
jgi:hypothetical protein